jgi:IS5 family transposase
MFKSMLVSAAAIMVAGAALTAAAPAQAQVGIEIGPRGVRAYEDRAYRPVVERRERRIVVQDDEDEEVCHTEIRKRRTASGSVITKRIRVCE